MSNKNTQVQKAYGNLNLANVARAVGPSYLDAASGQVRCGTAASPIAGCVAWNPLLPYGSSGQGSLTNNQALQLGNATCGAMRSAISLGMSMGKARHQGDLAVANAAQQIGISVDLASAMHVTESAEHNLC